MEIEDDARRVETKSNGSVSIYQRYDAPSKMESNKFEDSETHVETNGSWLGIFMVCNSIKKHGINLVY